MSNNIFAQPIEMINRWFPKSRTGAMGEAFSAPIANPHTLPHTLRKPTNKMDSLQRLSAPPGPVLAAIWPLSKSVPDYSGTLALHKRFHGNANQSPAHAQSCR